MSIQDTIREQVTSQPVVLYMKGTPQFPQCGFSAPPCEMLKRCGVDEFFSVNVLDDAEIRQGIKEYLELADDSAALRQRRVRRRLRHHARDVCSRASCSAAGSADGVARSQGEINGRVNRPFSFLAAGRASARSARAAPA